MVSGGGDKIWLFSVSWQNSRPVGVGKKPVTTRRHTVLCMRRLAAVV